MRNFFGREHHAATPARPSPAVDLPGFFGKAPAVGDFISRNIPHEFAPVWEAWLQELLLSSRELLGARWQEAWLEMPVWHFVLGAGIVATLPACGVLIPSVDRVGRHYPMTILAVTRPSGLRLGNWALQAEQLALSTLEDGFDPEELASSLALLGPPESWQASVKAAAPGLSALTAPEDWPEEVADAARDLAPGETLWWCRGSPRVAAMLVRSMGLPSPERSARFVVGFEFGKGEAVLGSGAHS